MAEIDVTDVLIDFDVAGDSFTVLRRQEVVGNNGVASVVTTQFPNILGSVQPTGYNSLIRDEGFDSQAKTMKVITQFRLRGPSRGSGGDVNYKPDQVAWRGDLYEVRVLDDWTLFGGGFVKAECVQITYVGTPPR